MTYIPAQKAFLVCDTCGGKVEATNLAASNWFVLHPFIEEQRKDSASRHYCCLSHVPDPARPK